MTSLQFKSLSECSSRLETLKVEKGFEEPDRGDLSDPKIIWRTSRPNYTRANLAFFEGKSKNHKAGSLEKIVEDLVKTWEMEASHFSDFSQWTTVCHDTYVIKANFGDFVKGSIAKEIGNYNALLQNCPRYRKYTNSSFEESHQIFKNVFGGIFPWETLEVKSGPPDCQFSWRHWGYFGGSYEGNKGAGQLVEMFGVAKVTLVKVKNPPKVIQRVQDEWKIEKLRVFFDGEELLATLDGSMSSGGANKTRQNEILNKLWAKAAEAWKGN